MSLVIMVSMCTCLLLQYVMFKHETREVNVFIYFPINPIRIVFWKSMRVQHSQFNQHQSQQQPVLTIINITFLEYILHVFLCICILNIFTSNRIYLLIEFYYLFQAIILVTIFTFVLT